jgi:hypothetical protein
VSLVSDMLAAGNSVLAEVHGTYAGTITPRGASAVAFTGARITRHEAPEPQGDETTRHELDLSVPVANMASAPVPDSALSVTSPPSGVSAAWRVVRVSTQAPGGVPIAYRVFAERVYRHGVLQSWNPGGTEA